MMQRLELTDFTPHIGTEFTFTFEKHNDASVQENGRSEIGSFELKLTHTSLFELSPKDMRATDTSGKYRSVPFSAFFENEGNEYLRQGQYLVKHPGFPEPLEIFIVPLGPNETRTGFLYEAAFG